MLVEFLIYFITLSYPLFVNESKKSLNIYNDSSSTYCYVNGGNGGI